MYSIEMFLTRRQIRRGRKNRLQLSFAILNQKHHRQSPSKVRVYMAMHQPSPCFSARNPFITGNSKPFNYIEHTFICCNRSLPGLSATNRMATQPPGGVPIVFLTGGSMRLNLAGSVAGLKLPKPEPTT